MIKFFRKIRQKMITESRVSKYLLYAIGEIILVVIGILLALQINSWNSERLAQQQEQAILLELQSEYEEKKEELNQKVALRFYMMDNSMKLIALINAKDYTVPLDSLHKYMGGIFLTPTFDASNSVTDELINSGKLYILSNKNLRKRITGWKAQIAKLKEEEQVLVNLAGRSINTAFFKYYPQLYIKNPFFSLDKVLIENFVKYSEEQSFKDVTSTKEIDLERFYNDVEIENMFGQAYRMCVIANMQSYDTMKYIDSTLALIEAELHRKEE